MGEALEEMRREQRVLRRMWRCGNVSFRHLCKLAMCTDVAAAAFLRRKKARCAAAAAEQAAAAQSAEDAAAERSREAVELSKVCAPSSRAPPWCALVRRPLSRVLAAAAAPDVTPHATMPAPARVAPQSPSAGTPRR